MKITEHKPEINVNKDSIEFEFNGELKDVYVSYHKLTGMIDAVERIELDDEPIQLSNEEEMYIRSLVDEIERKKALLYSFTEKLQSIKDQLQDEVEKIKSALDQEKDDDILHELNKVSINGLYELNKSTEKRFGKRDLITL